MLLPLDTSPRLHRWPARVVTTLAAWLAAFLLVTTLLTLFGEALSSLPLALRALVLGGLLVALMANLVMPILSAVIAHWMAGGPQAQASAPARVPKP